MSEKPVCENLEKRKAETEKNGTRTRETSEALRERDEKYRRLFEGESDALMIFDGETGQFEDANKMTLNLYGYSKDEFLNLTVEDISAEKEKTRIAVQKIKEGNLGSHNVPIRLFKKKNGDIFPGEITAGVFDLDERKKIIGIVRDISHRIQMEKQLRESEAKYRKIFENIQDVFFQTDLDGNIIDISPSIKRYTNFTREELIGQSILKLYYNPEDRDKLLNVLLKNGEVIDYELQIKSKNNQMLYGSLNAHILYDDAGQPIGGEGSVRDITESRLVKERLRESEEKYRSLIDNIAIGVALISPEMEILTLNNQMKRWCPDIDVSSRPLCYRSFNNPPRDRVCAYCPTIMTLHDGEVHEAITDTPAGDQIMHYRILSSPIKDHTGKVVSIIEVVEDISERMKTEEHIQNLSHQILNAQEEERQMISMELHDSVAQDLSTLKISLEMLFDDQSKWPLEKSQKLSQLSKILDRAINSVRNLSYDLRPPGLEEFGLIQTLFTYCEEFSKITGINVAFHSAGLKNAKISPFIAINIYRLIQEGLNNVRKHAEAGQATVRIVGAYPDIIVRIEDNGRGFDMQVWEHNSENKRRMGLRSMRERVKLLQGQMMFKSRPLEGTKIFIKIPFKEDKNGSEKKNTHY